MNDARIYIPVPADLKDRAIAAAGLDDRTLASFCRRALTRQCEITENDARIRQLCEPLDLSQAKTEGSP